MLLQDPIWAKTGPAWATPKMKLNFFLEITKGDTVKWGDLDSWGDLGQTQKTTFKPQVYQFF